MLVADIKGVDELNHLLKVLPGRVAKRALASATRSAAQVIVKRAKRLVPVDTGNLKKHIRTRKTSESENSVTVSIYISKKAFYGAFIEKGYMHVNRDKSKTYRPPKPFLRPALDAGKDEVLKKLGEKLWSRIEIEVLKLA